jgi:hypothetical protein
MDWAVSTSRAVGRAPLDRGIESFGEDECNEMDEYNQIVGEDELKDDLKHSINRTDKDLVDTCLKCSTVVVAIVVLMLAAGRLGPALGSKSMPASRSIKNAVKYKAHGAPLDSNKHIEYATKRDVSHNAAVQECAKANGVLSVNGVVCCLAKCGECGGKGCEDFLDGYGKRTAARVEAKRGCCVREVMQNGASTLLYSNCVLTTAVWPC